MHAQNVLVMATCPYEKPRSYLYTLWPRLRKSSLIHHPRAMHTPLPITQYLLSRGIRLRNISKLVFASRRHIGTPRLQKDGTGLSKRAIFLLPRARHPRRLAFMPLLPSFCRPVSVSTGRGHFGLLMNARTPSDWGRGRCRLPKLGRASKVTPTTR